MVPDTARKTGGIWMFGGVDLTPISTGLIISASIVSGMWLIKDVIVALIRRK